MKYAVRGIHIQNLERLPLARQNWLAGSASSQMEHAASTELRDQIGHLSRRQSVWLETALSSVELSRSICVLAEPAGQRTVPRKSQEVFGSEKPVVKLQSACSKKLVF